MVRWQRTKLESLLAPAVPSRVAEDDLLVWADRFRVLQGWEVRATYGDYLRRERPALGPGVGRPRWIQERVSLSLPSVRFH